MICTVCERQECVEPWTICPSCWKSRVQCDRAIPKIDAQLRKENFKLIGRTSGRWLGAQLNERRDRKMIRPLKEFTFGEYEDYEEPE